MNTEYRRKWKEKNQIIITVLICISYFQYFFFSLPCSLQFYYRLVIFGGFHHGENEYQMFDVLEFRERFFFFFEMPESVHNLLDYVKFGCFVDWVCVSLSFPHWMRQTVNKYLNNNHRIWLNKIWFDWKTIDWTT